MELLKIYIHKNTNYQRFNIENNWQGFSLIEILIVMGLLAIIAGFGLVVSLDSYRSYNFRSEQNLIISLLQKARNQSINNINEKPHGLHIDQAAKTYTLFQGANYAHRDTAEDIIFQGNDNYQLAGLSEIIFTQLSGRVADNGDIILADGAHPAVIININDEGRINLP